MAVVFLDATWFFAGNGVPQHSTSTLTAADLAQIVMPASEFIFDGYLMRLEYYGSTAGQITFLVSCICQIIVTIIY